MSTVFSKVVPRRVLQKYRGSSPYLGFSSSTPLQHRHMHTTTSRCFQPTTSVFRSKVIQSIKLELGNLERTPIPLYIRIGSSLKIAKLRHVDKDWMLASTSKPYPAHYRAGIELRESSLSFNEGLLYRILECRRVEGGIGPEQEQEFSHVIGDFTGSHKNYIMTPKPVRKKPYVTQIVEIPEGTLIPDELILNQWRTDTHKVFYLGGSRSMDLKLLFAKLAQFLKTAGTILSPKQYADKVPVPEDDFTMAGGGPLSLHQEFLLGVEDYEPQLPGYVAAANAAYLAKKVEVDRAKEATGRRTTHQFSGKK